MVRILLLGLMVFSCVPQGEMVSMPSNTTLYDEDCEDCELLIYNFASSNWDNKDYKSAVKNYEQAIKCGCGSKYAEDIYYYFGRSYIEINLYHKANKVFKQGLKYLPEDLDLLKIAAYNAHKKMEDTEQALFYYDEILLLEKCDVKTLESISKMHNEDENYESIPTSGMMVMFPSWLSNYTKPNQSNKRITVSFNTIRKEV